MNNQPPKDGWLDEAIEGVYRWTIDRVNEAGAMPPILGTGTAKHLSPSEAKATIQSHIEKDYISREEHDRLVIEARIDELEKTICIMGDICQKTETGFVDKVDLLATLNKTGDK